MNIVVHTIRGYKNGVVERVELGVGSTVRDLHNHLGDVPSASITNVAGESVNNDHVLTNGDRVMISSNKYDAG